MTGVQTCALPIFKAASNEVQSESLIAVISESALRKLLQGTLANSEISGAIITKHAIAANAFMVALIFI